MALRAQEERWFAFTSDGKPDASCPLAVVVTHRSGPSKIEAEALVVDSSFAEGAS